MTTFPEGLSLNIHPAVEALYPEMVSNRRWFHAHPELSFEEVETAAYVTAELRKIGLTEIYEKVGLTGVVGVIRGQNAGPTIGLRADMDALPIQET